MLACQRQLFSIPDGVHYLNAAYMSPLPKRVEEAGIAGIQKKRVPSDIVPSDFFEGLDTIRKLFARLIGSSQPSRVAVNPSASYGLATAARNIGIQAGQNVVIVAQAGLAGSTVVEDGAVILAQAGLAGHLRVGSGAVVGAQSGVHRDVPAGTAVLGTPERAGRRYHKEMAALGHLPDLLRRVRALERGSHEGNEPHGGNEPDGG